MLLLDKSDFYVFTLRMLILMTNLMMMKSGKETVKIVRGLSTSATARALIYLSCWPLLRIISRMLRRRILTARQILSTVWISSNIFSTF